MELARPTVACLCNLMKLLETSHRYGRSTQRGDVKARETCRKRGEHSTQQVEPAVNEEVYIAGHALSFQIILHHG